MSLEYFIPSRAEARLRECRVEVKLHIAPSGRFGILVEMDNFRYRHVVIDLLFGRTFEIRDAEPPNLYKKIVGVFDDLSVVAVMLDQFYATARLDIAGRNIMDPKPLCHSSNSPRSPHTINDENYLLIYEPTDVRKPSLDLRDLRTMEVLHSNIRETDAGVPYAARRTADDRLLVIGAKFFSEMSILESPLLAEKSDAICRRIPLVGSKWSDRHLLRGLRVREPWMPETGIFLDFLDDEHFVGVQRYRPHSIFVAEIRAEGVTVLSVRDLNLGSAHIRGITCKKGVTYVIVARLCQGLKILSFNLLKPRSLLHTAHFSALRSGWKFALPPTPLVATLPEFGPNPYDLAARPATQLCDADSILRPPSPLAHSSVEKKPTLREYLIKPILNPPQPNPPQPNPPTTDRARAIELMRRLADRRERARRQR